jgi:two-component system sensor histidine kinase BaeS
MPEGEGPRRRRGAGWHGRAQPPWWPENEAWPPDSGRWGSSTRRSGFWRPFGCLLLVFVLFVAGMISVAAWALAALVGVVQAPPIVVVAGVVGLVLVGAIVVALGRTLRAAAQPIDQLIAAAEHVEAGDYSPRVTEAGPRPLRRLARAFNTMSARLETSDRERRSFLADVSHELRTPLTVIQGQLEAIAEGVYPADVAHLAPVLEQTRMLERLVEDLRTVALAEAGSLQLALESTDLGHLVDEIVGGFRIAADERGVSLTSSAEQSMPSARVDRARIRQVMANLLDNALRHTPPGGRIAVSVARGAGGRGGTAIVVSDDGAGVPAELLPRIFERFAKSAGSPGSGLGLAIAKDLVEAHGGSIGATSTEGGGTTFRIYLPDDLE